VFFFYLFYIADGFSLLSPAQKINLLHRELDSIFVIFFVLQVGEQPLAAELI